MKKKTEACLCDTLTVSYIVPNTTQFCNVKTACNFRSANFHISARFMFDFKNSVRNFMSLELLVHTKFAPAFIYISV